MAGSPEVKQRRTWWKERKGQLFKLVLTAAGTPKDERDKALKFESPPEAGRGKGWQRYKDDVIGCADRDLIYLHASRILGVIAAAMIAALAIVATIAGTIYPAPAIVIVVNHGQVNCGPVKSYAKETGVSQVISVSNCQWQAGSRCGVDSKPLLV